MYVALALDLRGATGAAGSEIDHAFRVFSTSYVDPTFCAMLATWLARTGDLRRAQLVLDSMSARPVGAGGTDQAYLRLVKGEVELARGRHPSAVTLLQEAVSFDSSAQFLNALSRAQLANGDAAGAVRSEERVAGNVGGNGWEAQFAKTLAPFHLAQLYERVGDQKRAAVEYEKFLSQWNTADRDLPSIQTANSRLGSLSRSAAR